MSIGYDPEKHGSIYEYIQCHAFSTTSSMGFNGVEYFDQLWDNGYFGPGVSTIRVMKTYGDDEHYVVMGKHELQGMGLARHAGKPGTHDPRKIITKQVPFWQPDLLVIPPEPR